MRKFFYLLLLPLAALYSCSSGEPEFVVKGSTSLDRLNGELVFLVPYGSKEFEDSVGVDSVVIRDNSFEFRGKGEYLARITVDRRVRYGTQDLLIVTEAGGDIRVVIDSISSGSGTPQNDALQAWKERLTEHMTAVRPKIAEWNDLRHTGDTARASLLRDSIQQYNARFTHEMQEVVRQLAPGTARDFLKQRYGDGED